MQSCRIGQKTLSWTEKSYSDAKSSQLTKLTNADRQGDQISQSRSSWAALGRKLESFWACFLEPNQILCCLNDAWVTFFTLFQVTLSSYFGGVLVTPQQTFFGSGCVSALLGSLLSRSTYLQFCFIFVVSILNTL